MGSTKRTDLKLAMSLAIAAATVLMVLPGFLSGRAATTQPLIVQKGSGSGLDGARQAALEKLYSQFKAGAPFSEEERAILRRLGAGDALTDLEADVVISRALYDYYIAGIELNKEQQELLDRYVLLVSRRNQDIADIKVGYHDKQRQRAITAPDANCSSVTPPPNDSCAGAQVIPGAGPFPVLTTSVDVCAGTLGGDPPAPSCEECTLSPTFGVLTRSVWYTFSPTVTASYTISTCAVDTATTDGDPVMAIYTSTGGCAGPFTQVPSGCDDDTCADPDLGLRSIISNIPLNSGTQYFIVVWTCTTATPQEGETTLQLKVSRTIIPSNDTCAGAIPLALNTPVAGTNLAAINDYQLSGTTCFTGIGQTSSTATGRDVVYSFTAPSTDTYSFRVTKYSAFGNLVMYATTSCPAATPGVPVNITCNNVSGPAIAAANRSPGSTAEEIMCLSLTTAQQIFIFVDDNTAAPTFLGDTFTIEANRCSLETEPNNTPATANSIVFGGEGSINPSSDVDFFSLGTPASSSRVFAMIDGVASNSSDYDMRVTTATDTLEYDDLNNDAPFGPFSPNIGGTPLTGVPSFIRVDYFPPPSAAHEPYRIYSVVQPPGPNPLPNCVSLTTSATAETEPNNTSAQANSAANNYFSGSLSGAAPSTDVDVFSFTASAGQLVFISLDGDPCRNNTPIDGKLELLGTNGSTVLVSVNDSGFTSSTTSGAGSLTATTPNSPAEGLVFRVPAGGTYFARVSIGTTFAQPYGSGDYLLSIFISGPTAAKLSNEGAGNTASAMRYDDGVSVKWRTGFEVDNLGFNIYREENGKRARVNPQLVAGSALMVGAGTTLSAGRSYAWFDNAPARSSTRYWIEALDLNGESTWYGPLDANLSAVKSESADQASSPTLGQLGKSNPLVSETARIERRAAISAVGTSGVSIQAVVAGQIAAKLGVKSEGLYRVTQPELVAAGFNPDVDPRNLRLFVDGKEQPINVIAKEKFDASAAIEFYGVGLDSASTDEHVYWLVGATQAGQRIEQIPGFASAGVSQSFLSTVELKQRTVYFSALRNGDKENFFGAIIATNPVDQAMVLQHVDTGSANGAMLEVGLQGVTLAGHRVEVRINGSRAGEVVFDGQASGVGRLSIAQSLLKEGTNIVRLAPLGGASDVSLVDYVRLTYWHTFVADNDQLRFNVPAKQAVNVDGFSNGFVRVFDVTNPNTPQEILGTVKPSKLGYSVTLRAPGSGLRTLLAMTSGTAKRASNITLDQPSNWRQPGNAASFVIFTRREFMVGLDRLKALRQSQGYKVAVVDIEDVYDEFSYGNRTPQALKDFLAYARSNWKIAPRFVLLVGDASYDPKNYLGFGEGDLVPTKLIDTQFMQTASDDWLTDFDGDGLAEMAIGRLPVRSAGEVANLVAKLIGYDRGARSEGVLLVADDSRDGVDFEAISNELRGVIPADQRVEQINRGGLDPATAKSRLLDAINRGQRVINYDGHGNVDAWRGSLLTVEDANSMYNGDSLSLFVMMTCLNGYFHEAQSDSLAEALMKAEKGGAVAVWASSAVTAPSDQGVMDIEMFKRLFDPAGPRTLGEMALRAKAKGLNKDARLTWILLGDPTTTFNFTR